MQCSNATEINSAKAGMGSNISRTSHASITKDLPFTDSGSASEYKQFATHAVGVDRHVLQPYLGSNRIHLHVVINARCMRTRSSYSSLVCVCVCVAYKSLFLEQPKHMG